MAKENTEFTERNQETMDFDFSFSVFSCALRGCIGVDVICVHLRFHSGFRF
jgi:hypothetical protein